MQHSLTVGALAVFHRAALERQCTPERLTWEELPACSANVSTCRCMTAARFPVSFARFSRMRC